MPRYVGPAPADASDAHVLSRHEGAEGEAGLLDVLAGALLAVDGEDDARDACAGVG